MLLFKLVSKTVKKLVRILTTFLSIIVISKKADFTLNSEDLTLTTMDFTPSIDCMPYIYYLVQFKKDQTNIQALIDSDSEVNTMTRVYIIN